MSLYQVLESVRQRVKEASKRCPYGQKPVMIMGVAKGHPLTAVRSAAELGLVDLGENYAQELLGKAPFCQDLGIRWHYIGKLQSNKIKYLLPHISSIHSLDSLEHAERISRIHEQLTVERPPIPVLIQVNLGNDAHRAGLQGEVIEQIFGQFTAIPGVVVSGLMALPPFSRTPKQARIHFKSMKQLFDKLIQLHPKPEVFRVVSMGMSRDFEEAIEEGSTCVRLGEAIFGPRPEKTKDD